MTPETAFYIITGVCKDCGKTIGEIRGTGGLIGSTKADTISRLRGYLVICDYYRQPLCPECAEDRIRRDYQSETDFFETASAAGITGMYDSEIQEVGTRIARLVCQNDTGRSSSRDWRATVADIGSTAIGAMMIPEPVLGTLFGLLTSLVVRTTKWD